MCRVCLVWQAVVSNLTDKKQRGICFFKNFEAGKNVALWTGIFEIRSRPMYRRCQGTTLHQSVSFHDEDLTHLI